MDDDQTVQAQLLEGYLLALERRALALKSMLGAEIVAHGPERTSKLVLGQPQSLQWFLQGSDGPSGGWEGPCVHRQLAVPRWVQLPKLPDGPCPLANDPDPYTAHTHSEVLHACD